MYLWRLEKLKTEMAAQPLTSRQELPYLATFVGICAAVTAIPGTTHDVFDQVHGLGSTVLAVLAAIYIYRKNGGNSGQYFLQRYLAIGLVVSVRCGAALVPISALVFSILGAAHLHADFWLKLFFGLSFECFIYWRIAHHVEDLARKTTPVPLPS